MNNRVNTGGLIKDKIHGECNSRHVSKQVCAACGVTLPLDAQWGSGVCVCAHQLDSKPLPVAGRCLPTGVAEGRRGCPGL